MATQQAWDDFCAIKAAIQSINDASVSVSLRYMLQTTIKDTIKTAILLDAGRKAAVQAIADTHPVYTMAYIETIVEKLLDLNEYLEAQGFYAGE